MKWLLSLLGAFLVLEFSAPLTSAFGLPRFQDPLREVKEEVEVKPSASNMALNRALLSRFNLIGVRSLRGSPLMEMSPIILPLEQRAMWRNVGPPQLRNDANKYYNKVNPVLYDMLVNRK